MMLIRLSTTNLQVADPAQDVRGYRVVDTDGREVGEVEDLILDRDERKVRFLEVASGDLFGLGPGKTLIPLDVITRISEQVVSIDQTHQHVAAAPRYNPDLMVQDEVGHLYRHYGVLPYWGPSYVYPHDAPRVIPKP
jgi:sporulation protein YlmC with PRC-barrel domain